MPLLIQCPNCKKLLSHKRTECVSRTGKGCGVKIPAARKIYYIQFKDSAGRIRQKMVGPSKKAAENLLRTIETEVCENRFIDRREVKKVLIRDFIKQDYRPACEGARGYSTKKYCINVIDDLWGNKFLDELTKKDVETYKWNMQKADKKVMFNRVLAALSHMYTKAMDYEVIDRNPIPGVTKLRFSEKSRTNYLEKEQIAKLLEACPPHIYPVVFTALHTGMRRSEILGLRLGQEVDLNAKRINLKRTKNSEQRFIPMTGPLHKVLSEVADGKENGDYLFTWNGKRMNGIKSAWATALKRAELEGTHFHDLRHTFASHFVMNEGDLYVLNKLLGHKDFKMTQKYAHLSPDYTARAVSVVEKAYGHETRAVELPILSKVSSARS